MGCTASANSTITTENTQANDQKIIAKKPSINKCKTNKDSLDLDYFINQMLKLHNDERKKNNYEELKINGTLNLLASEYSDNLISNPKKVNYTNYMYNGLFLGENIVYSETKEAKKIFNSWLKTGNNYETNKNKFSKENAHYTQIIWKNTKEIGISMSYDEETKKYCTVVLYNPPGNTLGSFPENT